MDPTRQLSAIPFEHLIGAPLAATVKAQALAARSSLEFIQAVGFDDDGSDTKKVKNVTFKYRGPGGEQTLEVPVLTIVPIPFIKVNDLTIQFKANLSASSETEEKTESESKKEVGIKGGARWLFFSASLNGSYSSKKDSSSTKGSKYSVEYTVDVTVNAGQDDMPAGMAKVLNLLTDSIETQIKSAGQGSGE